MRSLRTFFSLLLALSIFGIWEVYTVKAQAFTFSTVETDLPILSYGAFGFADINQDGRFDMIGAGNVDQFNSPFTPQGYIGHNVGEKRLASGVWGQSFAKTLLPTPLWHGAIAWADYDNDGDLDFVINGTTRITLPFDAVTRIYRNTGTGQFEAINAGLEGLYGGSLAWGDYDNDGDADLLAMGSTASEAYRTILYRNDGTAGFVAVSTSLPDMAYGIATWVDFDNDQDLDLLLSGALASGTFSTQLFRNAGEGRFEYSFITLPDLAFSDADWGDYDNDGDLDLVLSGARPGVDLFEGQTWVYQNHRGAGLTSTTSLPGILYGTSRWGDYDSDGDLDVMITGAQTALGFRGGWLFENEGTAFVKRETLIGAWGTPSQWGDYDGDGDLDLLTSGMGLRNIPYTHLYRNNTKVANAPPQPPGELQVTVQGNTAILQWNVSSDDRTPVAGLTYNLRVGTTPQGSEIMAPLSSVDTGYRWLSARGNVDQNTRWVLKNLPIGTYTWSVQAVDHGLQGSRFASEATFTITTTSTVRTDREGEETLPQDFRLYPVYPNPARGDISLNYALPRPATVSLSLYNLLGAEVARLAEGRYPAGRHQIQWQLRDLHGRPLAAGMYFFRMQVEGQVWSQAVTILP